MNNSSSHAPATGSIRSALLAALLALALFNALSLAPAIHFTWNAWQEAKRAETINAASTDFFKAVRSHAIERGRAIVSLRSGVPVSAMEWNRRLIEANRTAGDEAMDRALATLPTLGLPGLDHHLTALRSARDEAAGLRQAVDREMLLEKPDRSPDLPERWFAAMTGLMESMRHLVAQVSMDPSQIDGRLALFSSLKLHLMEIRDFAGREVSSLAMLLALDAPLPHAEAIQIAGVRGSLEAHWQGMLQTARSIGDERIDAAVARASRAYTGQTRGLLDAIFHAAIGDGRYPIRYEELTDSIFDGMEAIAGIMDAVVAVTSGYAAGRRQEALAALLVQVSILVGSIGMVAVAAIILKRRIVDPTSRLIGVMQAVAAGGRPGEIPDTGRADEIGEMARAVAVFRDTAVELETAREAAEASTRVKGVFLASVAHELRTPLNAVVGLTHLLADDGAPPAAGEARTDRLAALRDASGALQTLISDILDLSRIEAGKAALRPQDFDPFEFAQGALRLMSLPAEEKRLALVLEADPTLPRRLRGDPDRLRQILLNLLGNAIKFTAAGRIVLSVKLDGPDGEKNTRTRLLFAVRDTGPGIAAEELETIFETFAQAAPDAQGVAGASGGAGLGLAIARGLVEMMDGTIRVESEPGKGSIFTFTVMLDPPLAPESSPIPAVPASPIRLSPARPLRILLAEDDGLNRMIASEYLTRRGHTVTGAADGHAVLERMARERFDVVLLDLSMPGLDGLETARRIRSGEAVLDPATVLVALTGSSLPEDREQCRAAGMDWFLAKPVDLEELLRELPRLADLAVTRCPSVDIGLNSLP